MGDKLQNVKKNLSGKIDKLLQVPFNGDVITPFEEKGDLPGKPGSETRCAHDLFSMFTADIIKKCTLFTR